MLGRGHKNFLFFKIGVPDPIRHYYQYRNSIILSRLNYVPVKWKLSRFIIHIFKLVFFLFYDQRLIRLKYAIKGIKDGLFNKTGKLI
jgi:rhamnosyltransferase